MEKQHRDLVMELITAHSQAQEAYERQVELEVILKEIIDAYDNFVDYESDANYNILDDAIYAARKVLNNAEY